MPGRKAAEKDSAGQKQDSCPAELFYTLVHILHRGEHEVFLMILSRIFGADEAERANNVGIGLNILLSAFKLLAGLLAHSAAMVSDAVHSASDVFSGLIVMLGLRVAARDADREHPYGHERFECVAALILAAVLAVTALFIGLNAVRRLSEPGEAQVPGVLALIAAVVSIAVKEGLFRYTRRVARKVSSPALMAGAWHHRSDALSSVGALIGIGGAMLGFPAADAAASLVICVFIGKAAFDISSEAVRGMVDRSADAETEEAIRRSVLNVPGVEGVDLLHTRSFGSRVYVEIEIRADGHLSLFEAHAIAEDVHNRVEAAFPQVKHIMVHVNPVGEP